MDAMTEIERLRTVIAASTAIFDWPTTGTAEIIEFLTAQLDEDERIARAAIADGGDQDGGFEDAEKDLTTLFPPRLGDDAARMISVFAVPRRILREVEAKRRHIERWQHVNDRIPGSTGDIRIQMLDARRAYALVIADDAAAYLDPLGCAAVGGEEER
jgi:hypothetical protein